MSGNVYAQTQEQLNIYFSYGYLFVLLHKRIKVIHRIIFYMYVHRNPHSTPLHFRCKSKFEYYCSK